MTVDATSDAVDADVLVVGGGAYGLCLALQLAEAGVGVQLVERGDFGSGVSGNSLRIMHGGLRYLQTFDLPRFRRSVRARREWQRAAPELMEPLRCLAPLARSGIRSRLPMAAAMALNNALSRDRNHGLEARQTLPASGIVPTPPDLADAAPGKRMACWWDVRLVDDARFAVGLALAAERAGCRLANHTIAVAAERTGRGSFVVRLRDEVNGDERSVGCRLIVDTTGRAGAGLRRSLGVPAQFVDWVGALNLRFRGDFDLQAAVAFRARDGLEGRGRTRDFFFVPEPDGVSVGTTYVADVPGRPEQVSVASARAQLLDEACRAAPFLSLDTALASELTWGWLPAGPESSRGEPAARLLDRAAIRMEKDHGCPGYFFVAGIKLTTAMDDARSLLHPLGRALGRTLAPSRLGRLDPDGLLDPPPLAAREALRAWAERTHARTVEDLLRRGLCRDSERGTEDLLAIAAACWPDDAGRLEEARGIAKPEGAGVGGDTGVAAPGGEASFGGTPATPQN
jgi:glycerol-3-phosphate dehydrogenase